MDKLIEVVARALYGCEWNAEQWPDSSLQPPFLKEAAAVLSAIEAAGMEIRPKGLSSEQIAEANELASQGMLAATPQE